MPPVVQHIVPAPRAGTTFPKHTSQAHAYVRLHRWLVGIHQRLLSACEWLLTATGGCQVTLSLPAAGTMLCTGLLQLCFVVTAVISTCEV